MSKRTREEYHQAQMRNTRLGLSAKVLQGILTHRELPSEHDVQEAVKLADMLIAEVDRTKPITDPESVLPKED